MKKTFLVVYEKGKKNYGGFAPDVPGCISLGDTLDEIRANLAEALQLHMETAVELGYPIPAPTSSTVTVNIPKPKLSTVKRVITKRRTLQAA